jgi:hypothetical protein
MVPLPQVSCQKPVCHMPCPSALITWIPLLMLIWKSNPSLRPCAFLSFYGQVLKTSPTLPCCRITACWLFITAYSIYLQLPCISGGCLLQMQWDDAPGLGDWDPIHVTSILYTEYKHHYHREKFLEKLIFIASFLFYKFMVGKSQESSTDFHNVSFSTSC